MDTVIVPPVFSTMSPADVYPSSQLVRQGTVGKKADVAAVILAGGSGERFGHRGGKQLLTIFEKPVLTWAIQAFDRCDLIGQIVVVTPRHRMDEYFEQAIAPYNFVTPIALAPAGMLRQESAMNGIEAVDQRFSYIAIHDGARPLVTPHIITHAVNVLKGTIDADGAVVGHSAIDTLKVVENGTVVGTPDRSMFWIAQTPQVFHAEICREAHLSAMAEGYIGTDDSSLIERIGGRVLLVDSPRDNIKVTVPEDLGPVAAALEQRLLHEGILDLPSSDRPKVCYQQRDAALNQNADYVDPTEQSQ